VGTLEHGHQVPVWIAKVHVLRVSRPYDNIADWMEAMAAQFVDDMFKVADGEHGAGVIAGPEGLLERFFRNQPNVDVASA